MTSQERHDARYQRRKAARQAKHRARIAQYDNFDRVADVSSLVDANYNARKGVMWKASVARYNARYFKNSIKIHKTLMRGGDTRRGFYHLGLWSAAKSELSIACTTLSVLYAGLPAQMLWCRFCPAI